MALQFATPDFLAAARMQPPGPFASAVGGALSTYEKFSQLQQKKEAAKQVGALRDIQTKLAQAKITGLPAEQAEQAARTKLYTAQAAAAQKKADDPLGGIQASGDVAQRLMIEKLKNIGYKPEVIQDMMDRYHATTNRMAQMARYYGMPGIAKTHTYEDVLTGKLPTIGQQPAGVTPSAPTGAVTPAPTIGPPQPGQSPYYSGLKNTVIQAQTSPQSMTSQQTFRLHQVKAAEQLLTSDKETRQQVGALNEIINQYNQVPFDKIKTFAGTVGYGKREYQAGKAALHQMFPQLIGPESEAYQQYQTFVNQAKGMTDQLRKALATSIRNQYVQKMLLPLVNTISQKWGSDPEIAEKQWRWLGNWLKSYRASYTKMINEGVPTDEIAKSDIVGANPELQMTAPGYVKGSDGKFYSKSDLESLARGK